MFCICVLIVAAAAVYMARKDVLFPIVAVLAVVNVVLAVFS